DADGPSARARDRAADHATEFKERWGIVGGYEVIAAAGSGCARYRLAISVRRDTLAPRRGRRRRQALAALGGGDNCAGQVLDVDDRELPLGVYHDERAKAADVAKERN